MLAGIVPDKTAKTTYFPVRSLLSRLPSRVLEGMRNPDFAFFQELRRTSKKAVASP